MIDIEDEVLSVLNKYNISNEETLSNTPRRVSRAFAELWRGLMEPPPKLAFFEAEQGLEIVVDDIEFNSTCEHHLMPFYGKCSIRIITNTKTLGLSKFNRIVRYFAARPTIQESLCSSIHKYLIEHLDPLELCVKMTAKHTCVALRGVHDSCSDTTTVMRYKKQ